jgi:thioredoxin reductase (NADPH)
MLGQHVYVVGAGNSAGQAAVHLARYAASVTVLARGEALGASRSTGMAARQEQRAGLTS